MVRNTFVAFLVVFAISCLAGAQNDRVTTDVPTSNSSGPDVASQIAELKRMLQQQQSQIESQQSEIEKLKEKLSNQQSADIHAPSLGQVASTTPVLPPDHTVAVTLPEPKPAPQAATGGDDSGPLSIRFKGITLTPGGFLAAETVYRQHGTGSDVNTPFNSVPFSGAGGQHMAEFFGSGRQSRITMLAEGNIGPAKLRGYYETDWLSAGITSNNNQSNSYTNRQRQLWGQAALNNGWTFTGGQMWSLVTETKNGLDNRTEALPSTVDAQYHVGFSWARQFGFRVTKNFNDKVWFGFAVENPQTIFGGHGQAANFAFGQAGTSGGLYNPTANYSYNAFPDMIFKLAFQPGWGHYEVVGIVSQFRDRIYPNATAAAPSVAGAFNNRVVGGGIGFNARGTIAKKVDVGIHLLGGDGVGRYGTSGLPDLTARPDGTLVLLRSGQALGTVEYHSKHWDVYWNAGVEYVGRATFLNAAGKPVGYGSPMFSNAGCNIETLPGAGGFAPGAPGTCNNDTRRVIEGTFGFYYKFYNGPKGKLQWGPQYSYVTRTLWSGVGGAPNAPENMLLTGFRYYLP